MRLLFISILLAFLTCCSTPRTGPPVQRLMPYPITAFKPSFIINHKQLGPSAEAVEDVMILFLREFGDNRVLSAFQQLTIIFTDEIDPRFNGLTYDATVILVRQQLIIDRISDSTLPHELLHVALLATTGDSDNGHTDKAWKNFLPRFQKLLIRHGY